VGGAVLSIYTGRGPETTFWGVVIALISIAVMLLLIYRKQKVGIKLNSEAILADSSCTRICVYMSLVLLAASALFELTRIPYFDAAGTLGLAWFSFKEGRECFEKAAGNRCTTCSC
jgi:divalent metal cation (Fe/Co/Zn/Cd) transporter